MTPVAESRKLSGMRIQVFIAAALLSLAAGEAVAEGVAGGPAPGQAAPAQAAVAAEPGDAVATKSAPRRVAQRGARSGIDTRVQLLAKELDLDERQRVEVRRILVQQREEVKQAWSDESVPAEVRVATMRAAGDRTAARIRAILNDSQRDKYIKARPAAAGQAKAPSELDSWIGAVGGK
jgi:hypothetical protein